MGVDTLTEKGTQAREDAANGNVTEQERSDAAAYLAETRDGLLAAVTGLSEEQWAFKPAPNVWSAAENLEHIVIVEGAVLQRINQSSAAANAGERCSDAKVIANVLNRSKRFQAPEVGQPTGRWTSSESLENFGASRQRLLSILDGTPDLRSRFSLHPVLGSLDAYQWILAASGHTCRHTMQIVELKLHPQFPSN